MTTEDDEVLLVQKQRSRRLERLRFSRDYLDTFVGSQPPSE